MAQSLGSGRIGSWQRGLMQACDQCGARMPQLPVRIEIVRESGPIGLATDPRPGETANFTKGYASAPATTPTTGRASGATCCATAAHPVRGRDAAVPARGTWAAGWACATGTTPGRTSGRRRGPPRAGRLMRMQKFIVTGGVPLHGEVRSPAPRTPSLS